MKIVQLFNVHVSTVGADYCSNDPVVIFFNLLKDYVITNKFYENKNIILTKQQPLI